MGLKEKIEKHKDVCDTDDFVKNFKHDGITKEEAQLVLNHAKEKYSLLVHDVEYLDNKADLLIKYLGIVPPGLAAISGYLGLVRSLSCGWLVPVGIIGGIVAWVAAISCALWVLKPTDMPYPPSVRKLFEELKDKKENKIPEATLALKYSKTISRLIKLGDYKGARLKWGYVLTAVSIFLLLLSFVAGRI
jgi:hypothetical protein